MTQTTPLPLSVPAPHRYTVATPDVPFASQLWRHALEAVAEAILAGFASVGGRCTPMGRASMSLDLQQASAFLWNLQHVHG